MHGGGERSEDPLEFGDRALGITHGAIFMSDITFSNPPFCKDSR